MLIRFFLVLAFIAGVRPFIAAAQKEGETMKSKEFFPERKGGWDLQKGVKRYDEEGIFKYMDGAGEVYRLYGFRVLTVARCARSGQPEITIELFDMGTSEDAFGVFTHSAEGDSAGVGQGSYAKPGLVKCLPRKGLVKGSVRFFHRRESLDCHQYLSDSNLLALDSKTDWTAAFLRKIGDGNWTGVRGDFLYEKCVTPFIPTASNGAFWHFS